MKCLAMVSVLLACATYAATRSLAAAENLPPLPAVAPLAGARSAPPPGVSTPADHPTGQDAAEPGHDPTRPSPMMRQLIAPVKLPGQSKAPETPSVELKSRIIGRLQPAVAVLGIDKQTYVVNKGSEFMVAGAKYGGQIVRVIDINADAVRLEIQPMNLSVILR